MSKRIMNIKEVPHGGGLCIRSLKKSIPEVNIPKTKNFDFANAIESVYPLLDIILSFLDYKDLINASQVNKAWKEVADKILLKRCDPSWFTCYKIKGSNILKYSDNLNKNNIGIGIILYNSRRIKLTDYICIHREISIISLKPVAEYITDELIPPNIEYCLISCPRVVSQFPIKEKALLTSTFDGLILPKIPNVQTTMFHCNPVKKLDIKNTIDNFIKPNHEVKCILLFCKNDLRKSIYNLLDALVPGLNPLAAAIGGGIIRGTKTFQNQKKVFSLNDVFCIAFTKEKEGKCDFSAFSVVISGDDLSKEEFEAELIKFRKNTELRSHSAAFRICCSAKVDTDEELDLFEKVFPNVPLLGMDADGEIGWNCYNNVDPDSWTRPNQSGSKRMKKNYPVVQHQWSTVLVLLTWGNLVTK
ncbi:unnamed protein product [Brassicogethes aeneus]|uniref:F-box domain-containing protein n=1 Tax=Brassicogethes aeneus TaxID=1431903 RepID=A0A9P0FA95_BRAAE|nr:unnamed protein product [Brassicogethes aeneus]